MIHPRKSTIICRLISIRRTFYGQILVGQRLIYERSAGQFHKQRQRVWAWKLLVRHFLERLKKIPSKVERQKPRPFIRYKQSYIQSLRRRKMRMPWYRPWWRRPYLYAQRRRPMLVFSLQRYQPSQRWFSLQREIRLWLRGYRKFLFKVRVLYTQQRPHNGLRRKKARRK